MLTNPLYDICVCELGEGPSRGLLRDCENFADGSFAALILDLGSTSSLALLEFIIFGGELSQTSVVIKYIELNQQSTIKRYRFSFIHYSFIYSVRLVFVCFERMLSLGRWLVSKFPK